jgi:tetratricopeptide (TPR) repeat protein
VSHPAPVADDLDLLLQVWEAERTVDFSRIRTLLAPLSLERVLATDEYIILLVLAYARLGYSTQAATLLQAAASVFPPTRRDRNRTRFLNAAADYARRQGRLSEAEAMANEMLEYAHRTRDDSIMLNAFVILGITSGMRGDYVQSLRHFNRALASDSGRWTSVIHHNLALSYRELGFVAESQRHFEQAARHPRADWLEAGTMLDRAILLHLAGDEAAATELALRALEWFERIQSRLGMAEARTVLARIAASEGKLEQARQELESAFETLPPGDALLTAQAYEEAAVVAVMSGDVEARDTAQAAAEELYLQMEAGPRIERMRLRLEVLSATAV